MTARHGLGYRYLDRARADGIHDLTLHVRRILVRVLLVELGVPESVPSPITNDKRLLKPNLIDAKGTLLQALLLLHVLPLLKKGFLTWQAFGPHYCVVLVARCL